MDTLLLPNEMCGEGLTQTDGEDYRISDCEAGRQSAGGGLISELLIRHSSFAPEEWRKNTTSLNQDNDHFLHLHRPRGADRGLV